MPTYSTLELSSSSSIKKNNLHPLFKMYRSIKQRPIKKFVCNQRNNNNFQEKKLKSQAIVDGINKTSNSFLEKTNSIFNLYKWKDLFFEHRDPFFDYPAPIYPVSNIGYREIF